MTHFWPFLSDFASLIRCPQPASAEAGCGCLQTGKTCSFVLQNCSGEGHYDLRRKPSVFCPCGAGPLRGRPGLVRSSFGQVWPKLVVFARRTTRVVAKPENGRSVRGSWPGTETCLHCRVSIPDCVQVFPIFTHSSRAPLARSPSQIGSGWSGTNPDPETHFGLVWISLIRFDQV